MRQDTLEKLVNSKAIKVKIPYKRAYSLKRALIVL
jgi:hypothetical protein